jgi:hypothetical protein
MDPLSYHSVNPFATFYPPQSAEYDVCPVRDIISCQSSQITPIDLIVFSCLLKPNRTAIWTWPFTRRLGGTVRLIL